MARTHLISQVGPDLEGQEVGLAGWVYRYRDLGSVVFIVLRDATGIIQAVVRSEEVDPGSWEAAKRADIEASVKLAGVVRLDPRAPGGVEVRVTRFKLVGESPDFPIKKDAGVEFRLDKRHLDIRSRRMWAVLRIRAEFMAGLREWFDFNGFIPVEAPTFVSAAVEGGATLFELDYFGRKAYLTQSSQFYLEAAIFTFEKVYTIQPSFRAEKSRTRRHLTEFWHAEAEMAWHDLDSMMDVAEALVDHAVQRVYENRKEELEILGRKFEPPQRPYPRISYDEAIDIAQSRGVQIEWGDDMSTEAERVVSLEFDRPVFVHRYPKQAKAFYHAPDPARPEVVLCADLLAPEGIGEIIGGGQRIHSYEELVARIREEGLRVEDYEWYLDLRRYGSVPHAGFGLGVERTVRWIAGIQHIRDAVAFPRTPTRLTP